MCQVLTEKGLYASLISHLFGKYWAKCDEITALRLVKAPPHWELPNITRQSRLKVTLAMVSLSWHSAKCFHTDFSDICVWQYYHLHVMGEERHAQGSNDLPLITGLISGRGWGLILWWLPRSHKIL